MNLYLSNMPGSLRAGNGTAVDPFNVSVMPIRDALRDVAHGDTVCFGTGVFKFGANAENIGWDVPDGVNVVGESMDRTVLVFECPDNAVFLGLRHRGVTTNCNVEFSRMTLLMPKNAVSTTGIQAFGDNVLISHVRVSDAVGPDYDGVEQGSGLPEGFQIFGSNRVPGSNNFRPGSKTVEIAHCVVVYRQTIWRHYSTGITCDAAGEGHVYNCAVDGDSHAGFTGSSCVISKCVTSRVNHLFYFDTYHAGDVSISDCLAADCETLLKSISAGGISGVALENNIAYARIQDKACYLVYLINAIGVRVEGNVFYCTKTCGLLGADIGTCIDIRLVNNVVCVPSLDVFVQAPDTFAYVQDWRSVGNRVRVGGAGLTRAYDDTV